MRSAFFKIVVFLLLISCSNVNFLLTQKNSFDFLQNKTAVYVDGWEKTVLKENLFSMLGDVSNQRFVLTAKVSEEKKNRSVSENQVAQKIDYKITISYTLVDVTEKCPDLKSTQTSRFSFTPKSYSSFSQKSASTFFSSFAFLTFFSGTLRKSSDGSLKVPTFLCSEMDSLRLKVS